MFKTVLIALTVLAVAVTASSGVPTVTVCSAPNAWLTNLQYTISPNNIVPGVTLNVSVSGTLTQTVTKAMLQLSVTFDGIPIVNKKENVCTDTKNPFPCPIAAGPMHYDIVKAIPNLPLSGPLTAKAVLTSQTGAQIVCLKVDVNV